MRLREIYVLTLVSALITAFSTLAHAVPQDPAPSSTPPGNNAPLVQPAALSGAEDKSYLSAAAGGEGIRLGKYPFRAQKDLDADIYSLKFPTTLHSFSIRSKVDGSGTYLAPEYSSMDVLSGVEGNLQGLIVVQGGHTVTGPGLSLRIDLSPSRFQWVNSYRTFSKGLPDKATSSQEDYNKLLKSEAAAQQNFKQLTPAEQKKVEDQNQADQNALRQDFWQKITPEFSKFLDDFFDSASKLRVSVFATNQWLDSAQLSSVGLSVSQVIPTRPYCPKMDRVWGLVPRVAAQSLFQDLSASEAAQAGVPHASSALRTSLGLALQNNIPHLVYDPKDKNGYYSKMPGIARWSFQVGAEYVYRNTVDRNESYGLYTRFRNLKNYTEVSLSVSRTPYKDIQFGIGFTFTTEGKRDNYE